MTLKPDFKNIADFRSANRAAFKQVFREFVILCRKLDLFGRKLLAVDGTRIKAVNNKDRNFTTASLRKFIAAVDKKLEDYLNRLDAATPRARNGRSRVKNLAETIEALNRKRGECAAHLSALEKSGESQVSLTDPDSCAMAAHTKVAVRYNIQVAVDAKHKMIVEQAVTNQVVDMGLLKETAEPARVLLDVEKIDVVADRGYSRSRTLKPARRRDRALCSQTATRIFGAQGFFRKDEFRYDPELDAFICPAGQILSSRYKSKLRDLKKIDYANRAACFACPIR